MALKIFKGFWFLSVTILLATLLYNYAGWREEVAIQDGTDVPLLMSREVLFYLLAATFAITNVLVYVVRKMFPDNEGFRTWFHGLVISVNVFFAVVVNLIGLYNSGETYDFSRIGFFVYGSLYVMLAWALCWPVYRLFQKFFFKQAI